MPAPLPSAPRRALPSFIPQYRHDDILKMRAHDYSCKRRTARRRDACFSAHDVKRRYEIIIHDKVSQPPRRQSSRLHYTSRRFTESPEHMEPRRRVVIKSMPASKLHQPLHDVLFPPLPLADFSFYQSAFLEHYDTFEDTAGASR